MLFPDFPFPSHLPSFVTHQDVLKYLQDYTEHYGLDHFIKFKRLVKKIEPFFCDDINTEGKTDPYADDISDQGRFKDTVKWKLTSVDVDSGEKTLEEYDAIFICNG